MKYIIAFFVALIPSALYTWGVYALWCLVLGAVPAGEYAALIKVGVGLAMFLATGGITFAVGVLIFMASMYIAALIAD